jgi:hypothetical protein
MFDLQALTYTYTHNLTTRTIRANIYYNTRPLARPLLHSPLRNLTDLRLVPFVIFGFLAVILLVPLVVMYLKKDPASISSIQRAIWALGAAMSFFCAIGFAWFGSNMLLILRGIVLSSSRTNNVFTKVSFFIFICLLIIFENCEAQFPFFFAWLFSWDFIFLFIRLRSSHLCAHLDSSFVAVSTSSNPPNATISHARLKS